ncbi:hypothetical protein GCM10025867_47070 (plasmid) [Frondihabitans sucicola]|uniref:Uncharacterized protein n=1 Tax=Frondihabitans sucicola TaxID=1268041 RepID=A0ABN6Y5P6_9MICO|nr:hypothetical protein [Frondihabitans sucicola]BDZ52466.1 hypothetical protein GCM10025867_47070 [Frondihabitans sucicola]
MLREQFLPDDVREKQCATCGQIKPVNKFRVNKAGSDGHAKTCEQCRRDAVAAIKQREEDEHLAARLKQATEKALAWVDAATAYQSDSAMAAIRCEAGHVLTAIATPSPHELGLRWRCSCGEASLTATHRQAISAHNDLVRLRETSADAVVMA